MQVITTEGNTIVDTEPPMELDSDAREQIRQIMKIDGMQSTETEVDRTGV